MLLECCMTFVSPCFAMADPSLFKLRLGDYLSRDLRDAGACHFRCSSGSRSNRSIEEVSRGRNHGTFGGVCRRVQNHQTDHRQDRGSYSERGPKFSKGEHGKKNRKNMKKKVELVVSNLSTFWNQLSVTIIIPSASSAFYSLISSRRT